jgi:hypothetical protein
MKRKMFKIYTAALALSLAAVYLLSPTQAHAQGRTEFGLNASAANYLGDLSDGINDLGGEWFGYFANNARPNVGAFIRFNQSNRLSYRGNISYGQLAASDALSTSEAKRLRNLSFRTNILEFSGMVEFNLRPFGNEREDRNFTPYVFAGLGIMSFNPQASWNGEWYDLQPLGTEGQDLVAYPDRARYALTVPVFPVGGGLRWRFNDIWRFGIEYGHRFLLTDYLDDVSGKHADPDVILASRGPAAAALADRSGEAFPGAVKPIGTNRGNPDNFDAYYFVGFTLSYLFDE